MPPRGSRRATKRGAVAINHEHFGAAYKALVEDEYLKPGARLNVGVMPSLQNPLAAADWRKHLAQAEHPVNLSLAEVAADAALLGGERLADMLHRHGLKEWRSRGGEDEDRSRTLDGEGVLALLLARYLANYNQRMQSLQVRWGVRLDIDDRRAVWDAIDVMAVPLKDSFMPALQRALDAVAAAPADEGAVAELVAALVERNRGQGHVEVLAQVECALLQLDELSKTMCDEVPAREQMPSFAEVEAMDTAQEAPDKKPAKRCATADEAPAVFTPLSSPPVPPPPEVHAYDSAPAAAEKQEAPTPAPRARLSAVPSWAEPVPRLEAVPLAGVNRPIFGNQNEWLDRLRKIYTDEQRSRMRTV